MNYPFIDGNKRAAFAYGITFLHFNGLRFRMDGDAAHALWMQWFGAGQFRMEKLLPWLREHVRSLENG